MQLSLPSGGDVLLGVCSRLPTLGQHMRKSEEALHGSEFAWPTSQSDATTARSSLQNLYNDLSVVWRIASLPILEPLNPKRLAQLITITLGGLHAAVTAAIVTSVVTMAGGAPTKSASGMKEDEMDGYAATVVQKAVSTGMSCLRNHK